MATPALQLSHTARFTSWFSDFLRKELAPYPGRGALVARVTIAATLSAILIITFRIPGGAIGAFAAFLTSRENLLSTAKSSFYILMSFATGALFIPIGSRLFASIPITHFMWEAASLFILFFLIRVITNYVLVINLCALVTTIFSIWYLPGPGEQNVELSLWQFAATLVGVLVTLVVEIVFYALYRSDEVIDGIDARLQQIENLMHDYAAGRPPSPETARLLSQYAMVGMGALRRHIARTTDEQIHRMRNSALVSLTGRSVDFAAALSTTVSSMAAAERTRAARLAEHIAGMRQHLKTGSKPLGSKHGFVAESEGTPLLSELEAIMAVIPSVFENETSIDPRLEVLEAAPASAPLFVADAFSNPEHLRFVLGGTFAAMMCYVLYVSLDWPGISTSVTTCVFTALSNIGASRQKQVLRFAGAFIGAFIFGIGAQIFVLPNIDSITGFTVLFATVTAISAWIVTSSSRLSYAGLQLALAFYLINLSEFRFQTSLTLARDRAIGVMLGSSMMWLVFERLYRPKPAADEMVHVFIRNLRLMAEIAATSPTSSDTEAIVKIRKQRDQAYSYFGEVNAQEDAVPFETGSARAGHMAARDRIRRWQASLRTFYLLEAPLLQFRIFGSISQKSRPVAQIDDAVRKRCAQSFIYIAQDLENQLNNKPRDTSPPPSNLLSILEPWLHGEGPAFSEREEALLRMLNTMASLVDRMQNEVASQSLYAIG
jgi:multidrug resistance protein MdtO